MVLIDGLEPPPYGLQPYALPVELNEMSPVELNRDN